MKRERQQIYYLEQIPHTARVVLKEDGRIAELEEVERDVTDHYPSRVPGRERVVITRRKVLGEGATYHTLKDYASNLSKQHSRALDPYDTGWKLEDIPSEVVEECNKNLDQSPVATLEEIRQAAKERAGVADYNETIPCKCCPADLHYHCYTSGSSKSLYRYPTVEIDTEDGTLMQPFDTTDIIAHYPDALQFVTEYDIRSQQLSAVKMLQLDLSRIPIVGGGADGKIVASDKIRSVKLPVAKWSEAPTRRQNQPEQTHEPAPMSADDLLNALQLSIAEPQKTHERVDFTDYDTRYKKLLQAVGSRGMILTLEMKYMGMGDSGWLFAGSRPSEAYGCIDWLGEDPDMRLALIQAYKERLQTAEHDGLDPPRDQSEDSDDNELGDDIE